jgi:hypothetical protein
MWARTGHPQHVQRFHIHTCIVVHNTGMHAVPYCHELGCTVCTCVSAKYEHIPWAIAAWALNIHVIMSAYGDVADVTAVHVGDRVFYLAPATKHTAYHPIDAYSACIWGAATSAPGSYIRLCNLATSPHHLSNCRETFYNITLAKMIGWQI